MTIKSPSTATAASAATSCAPTTRAARSTTSQIVAINDLGAAETNAHLTRYDTAHGKFPGKVEVDGDDMVVNGDRIKVFAQRDPAQLPWGSARRRRRARVHRASSPPRRRPRAHLKGGAKKVIISAPGGKDVDATVVYGVNHETLKASHTVISNASCTTNCLAPLVKPLHDKIGVVHGPHDHDPRLHQRPGADRRLPRGPAPRALGHACRMIPTKTGAAAAVGLVLPELNGKLDGFAIRVPTINVSLVDLVVHRRARHHRGRGQRDHEGGVGVGRARRASSTTTPAPLVSVDFNHDPARRRSTRRSPRSRAAW